MSAGAAPRERPPRAPVLLAGAALLAFWVVLVVGAGARIGRTADEGNYVNAGRVILRERGWNHVFFTNAQGPVQLVAGQLFLGGHELDDVSPEELRLARLGVLPFGLLLAAVVFLWSLRVHGPRGALVSLGLFALNPLTIGYASLFTVDVALAAFVALFAWLAWEHLRRPSAPLLVALGVALGLACGTKYVALLYAPIAVLLVAADAWRGGPGESPTLARRLLRFALEVLLVGAAALLTLHACYGFLPGLSSADPALYASDKVRALVSNPLTRPLVRLLPQAFTDGIDYQVNWSEGGYKPFLNGRFLPGHPGYYAWAVLLKTPELVLLLGLAWLALRLPRLVRPARDAPHANDAGPPERERLTRERLALWVVLPVVAVPCAYFSFLTTAQVGVRYVLPALPLAFVLLGGLANLPLVARLGAVPRAALGLALALPLGWDCLTHWPNLPAYYNRLFGGQAAAYRHFVDTNSDWNQLHDDGPALLRERGEADFEVLTAGHGPRFGRVAIYVSDLARPDPEDPTRSRHWLDPFEPVAHLDAAWWIFDVTPEAFARAARRDGRVALDDALALLGRDAAGDEAEAERVLAGLAPDRAAPAAELLRLVRAARAEPGDVALRRRLAQAWLTLGCPDRAIALLDGPEPPAAATDADALARALYSTERWSDVIRVLAPREDLARHPGLLLLLADAYRRERRPDEAIALLEAHLDDVLPATRPRVQATLDYLVRRRDGLARIRATLHGEDG